MSGIEAILMPELGDWDGFSMLEYEKRFENAIIESQLVRSNSPVKRICSIVEEYFGLTL